MGFNNPFEGNANTNTNTNTPSNNDVKSHMSADDINDAFKSVDNEDEVELAETKDDEEVLDLKDKKKDKKESKKAKSEEDSEEEPEEDEQEDSEEDDDSEEEEEDKIEIDAPPRKKEILKAFPDFFKKFPFMEKMMYRDKQYTELFGSFDDAKEAHNKAESLDEFETDLLKGNTVPILKSLKEQDPKAFDKLVDNYLPALASVDKDAYAEITGNVAKLIIMNLVQRGKETGKEVYNEAALFLNEHLFGSTSFTPIKPRVTEEPKDDKLEAERKAFIQEKFNDARGDIQTKVDNTLRATISQYIDPNDQLSAFSKKHAINEALSMLHGVINQDGDFRKHLDNLWRGAFGARFSQDSKDKIRSAYLGNAKKYLPSIIKKARAEALKDINPKKKQADEDEDDYSEKSERKTPKKGRIAPGHPRQIKGGVERKQGESVLDFLSRD